MRKLIIELKVKDEFLKNLNFILDKVESIELIELLKLDFKQRIKMGIAALNMKEGYTIKDIDLPDFLEMLTVLSHEGNRYIVLSKVKFYSKFVGIAKKFDIDILWTTPSIFTSEKCTLSVIGDEENLKKFLDVIQYLGDVKNKSYIKATFNEQSILSVLTERQKEMIIAAKNNGYYNYPRKVNSQELSKIVGLSKPTVIQHLRKAESRIVSNIFAGY